MLMIDLGTFLQQSCQSCLTRLHHNRWSAPWRHDIIASAIVNTAGQASKAVIPRDVSIEAAPRPPKSTKQITHQSPDLTGRASGKDHSCTEIGCEDFFQIFCWAGIAISTASLMPAMAQNTVKDPCVSI